MGVGSALCKASSDTSPAPKVTLSRMLSSNSAESWLTTENSPRKVARS